MACTREALFVWDINGELMATYPAIAADSSKKSPGGGSSPPSVTRVLSAPPGAAPTVGFAEEKQTGCVLVVVARMKIHLLAELFCTSLLRTRDFTRRWEHLAYPFVDYLLGLSLFLYLAVAASMEAITSLAIADCEGYEMLNSCNLIATGMHVRGSLSSSC